MDFAGQTGYGVELTMVLFGRIWTLDSLRQQTGAWHCVWAVVLRLAARGALLGLFGIELGAVHYVTRSSHMLMEAGA